MKDSAVVIRPYEKNDRDGVRGLLRATFGDSLGFDRFERGNPLGAAIGAVALAGNQVVGFNQWQPWLIPGADDISTFQSGASAVHESFRGQGLFSRLLSEGESQAQSRGVGFFIGFPNPASIDAFVRAGWQVAQHLSLRIGLVPGLQLTWPTHNAAIDELPSFYRWRYEAAGLEAIGVSEGRVAFVRRIRQFGLPAVKLVDVLDDQAKRPTDLLGGISRYLPLGRIVTVRSSEGAGMGGAVTVPRSWQTPFIVKRISGKDADARLLRTCMLLYGDIDAA